MHEAERAVRRWLRECVLALDLCPFAAPVVSDDSLRIVVSKAEDPQHQLQHFLAELDLLQSTPQAQITTTLLVFDPGLRDFDSFLELLAAAEQLLQQAGLSGLVQLASFHPHYLFEGEAEQSLSHYTNRSPYPVIHLLRESMLTQALEHYPDPAAIPRRNIARLEGLGKTAVEKLWRLGSL